MFLPFLAVTAAVVLSKIMGVQWDTEDCLIVLLFTGPPLALGLLLTRLGKVPAFASFLTIFSLLILVSLIEGALAMLGTRSPVPVADTWLAAADRALPLSGMEVVLITQQLPAWAISGLVKAYLQTGSLFLLTLILLHLMDREVVAWRIFLIWGWSFFVISLIAFSAPAVGCFSQLSADQVADLPKGAGRYALRKFYEFRNTSEPVLGFDRMSGVITFPSLHTVTALMIAQAWHGMRIVGPLSKVATGIIIFSCAPIGGHYLVDLIAGAAVWWVVTLAVDRLSKLRAAIAKTAAIPLTAA